MKKFDISENKLFFLTTDSKISVKTLKFLYLPFLKTLQITIIRGGVTNEERSCIYNMLTLTTKIVNSNQIREK